MKEIAQIGFVLLLLLASAACKQTSDKSSQEEQLEEVKEVDIRAMMTRDVSTLISDSGVTQYRITTPQWDVFERSSRPRWYFPEGLHVEKFDSLYQTDASIKADTGYFFTDKKLWRLVDNVRVVNQLGDQIETEELFWDQRKKKIYSDKFIHIQKEESIIEGYGFESNESMTQYVIRTPSGIFPVKEDDRTKQMDTVTVKNDSLAVEKSAP